MSAVTTAGGVVHFESTLLGTLDVYPETIVQFPAGLPGFAACTRFTLVATQRDDLVWLQSLDDAGITLLLADPFQTNPGFEVEIPVADLAALGLSAPHESLLVLVVAQLQQGVPKTGNFQSPIVIDQSRGIGRQVVLPDSSYGMHYPLTIAV